MSKPILQATTLGFRPTTTYAAIAEQHRLNRSRRTMRYTERTGLLSTPFLTPTKAYVAA